MPFWVRSVNSPLKVLFDPCRSNSLRERYIPYVTNTQMILSGPSPRWGRYSTPSRVEWESFFQRSEMYQSFQEWNKHDSSSAGQGNGSFAPFRSIPLCTRCSTRTNKDRVHMYLPYCISTSLDSKLRPSSAFHFTRHCTSVQTSTTKSILGVILLIEIHCDWFIGSSENFRSLPS